MGTDAREAFWRWLARKGGCRHDWHYTGPHGTGWLIARCTLCGKTDLA